MTSPITALGLMPAATPYASTTPATSGSPATGSTSSSTSSPSSSSADQSLLDPQAFLQLLVAQLQYQDPTNPVDTSSFMNQTAMLSQVQTMNSMSSTLSALADAQQAQSATALIGKQVTYLDDKGMRVSGTVSAASLLATGATLTVGTASVPLSSVVEVTDAPTS
jgi:flagellar basal-body rod modification protein FlgD